jgi:hypothetical protein
VILLLGSEKEEDEMSGTRSTHGRAQKLVQNFVGNLNGGNHSENLFEGGRRGSYPGDYAGAHLSFRIKEYFYLDLCVCDSLNLELHVY